MAQETTPSISMNLGQLGQTKPWYTTDPNFSGIDMSGYQAPRVDTMDVRNFYINGNQYTGGSHSANALKDYLDSTGQGNFFSWNESTIPNTNYGGELAQTTTPGVSNNAGQTIYGGSDGTTPVGTYDSYGMPIMGRPPTTGLLNGFDNITQPVVDPGWNAGYVLQQKTPVEETPAPITIPEVSPTFTFAQSLPSTTPQPSNSLFNFETSSQLLNNNNTINQPYVYGNLGPTSSDYSQWGSRGNPYITYGQNPYIPGQNVPILPQPITPAPSTGGDGGATSPTPDYGDGLSFTGDPYADSFNFSNTMQNSLFGQFPGVLSGLALYNAGINPLNQWFGYGDKYNENWAGSGAAAVGAYGLTPGEQMDMIIDQEAGMWDNPYEQDLWYTGSAALNPNEYELAQEYGWGSPEHLAAIEQTFNFGQADTLAAQSDAAIAQAQADALAAKEAAKQAEIDKIAGYTNMLQSEFDAQMAAQEDLNSEQIALMYEIKGDMQKDFGDFSSQTSQQMAQIAAENAAMFDSIEEYRQWQLDTDAQQQAWMENQFKDQAAQQNNLNAEQIALMDTIAMDMQQTYGAFTGEVGEQLAQMAAENASMFDSFAEYKQWMGESFSTLESGMNEQLAQQAAIQEGLNEQQISLMNEIAQDMQNQYGAFAGGIEGQLEQMAAENAAMFDSYAEYQAWNNSQIEQAAAEQAAAEAALAESALQEELDKQAEQFTDSSPGFEGDYGGGSKSEADLGGSATTTDDAYDEIGDYASYDDPGDSGGGDGGGGGGGSYIATATTQALGKDGLKVFEDWRDYMAKVYPTFKASYGRYRVTAPKIVSAIDKKENSKELYKEIWDKHLKPIFDLISKDKDSKKAQTDYKSMVRELKNKYLTGDKDAR